MTIPSVSMTWCQRIAQCEYCPDTIDAGMPMVRVFFWNRGTEEHKGFNTKKYYHPNCWVAQGLDYLNENPYVPYLRKPKMELTPEQSARRYVLLKRKASIDQRKKLLTCEYPDKVLEEAKLDIHITDIMLEIALIGGIPPKWLRHQTST